VDVAVGRQQELMTQRGQGDDRIKRIVPRVNLEVNGHWICDEGRLSYQRLDAAPRLATAQAPAGQGAEWSDAVARAAELLGAAASGGRAGAIVSPRLTCESMHAWKEFLDSLGPVTIGVRRIERGEDDAILIRADKGANSRGAAWIFGEQATEQTVLEAAARGEIETLLVLGDPLDPEDTARIDDGLRGKLANLIYVGPFVDATASGATVLLPCAAWAEEDGTYVNFEGRVQRVRRCHLPRGEGRPGWRVAADLGVARGLEPPDWTVADDVLRSLGDSVPAFKGLSEKTIGPLGVRNAAETAGA
jgi:NADH-quinone oxidoreductase subunit G